MITIAARRRETLLTKKAMKDVEAKLLRLPQLPSWFIDINYQAATG